MYDVVIVFLAIVLFVIMEIGYHINFASPMKYTHDVPNLEQVDPGVWRSGEPKSPEGWVYLKSLGIHKVVKLNYDSEGTDQAAIDAGMEVIDLSIPPDSTLKSTFELPDSDAVQRAANILAEGNGVLVHCTHGQDRTGLVVGVYRVTYDKWSKEEAWDEMVEHHFHQELIGLMRFWHRFDGTFPVTDKD